MPTAPDSWWPAGLTVALLAFHELIAWGLQRRAPAAFARSGHAQLREQWFAEVSALKGSEILAVQTLRNSLMSASMLASTAALALMGTLTLALPSLREGMQGLSPRLLLELGLTGLLFAALAASVMAVRYFNHASFIAGFPVGSAGRLAWDAAGRLYVRRAGVLYSVALRHLLLTVPVVIGLLEPWAGPVAAVAVSATLLASERLPVPGP